MVDKEDYERIGTRRLSLGSHGYAQIWDGQVMLLHRWIMGATKGDGRLVDHDDRNKMNCRKYNLCFVTPAESSANVTGSSASGYRGVYKMRSGRWAAGAKKSGKTFRLGIYDSKEEAAQVSH